MKLIIFISIHIYYNIIYISLLLSILMKNKLFVLKRFFSVNNQEMLNFNKIKSWWDPVGPMNILYQYNYQRTTFLKSQFIKIKNINNKVKPFQNCRILDVGCGAGLLSESLTRMGGIVTAIDPNQNSIKQALQHKSDDTTLLNLTYKQTTVENLIQSKQQQFDIVTSMQVVQHVQNPKKFVSDIAKMTKQSGIIMLSTISRSLYSYLTHIILAEYIFGIVPRGTHSHEKFINIDQLSQFLKDSNTEILSTLVLDLNLSGNFIHSNSGSNYLIIARKKLIMLN